MMLKKRGPHPGTGDFIKSHLKRAEEDYINNAYRAFCRFLKDAGQRSPTYNSFRVYWYVCTQLNLIEFVREEAVENLIPRRHYRLVQQNINSKAWRNPRAALDLKKGRTIPDPLTGKPIPVSRLGKRRYQRRVTGKPPQQVGRPKKAKVA